MRQVTGADGGADGRKVYRPLPDRKQESLESWRMTVMEIGDADTSEASK
jgi:hypothetical protein